MGKKLTYFYLVPMALVLLADCLFSILRTTYFELYMVNEVPSYKHDHPLVLGLMLLFGVGALYWGDCHLKGRPRRAWLRALPCLWGAFAGIFFVFLFRCTAVCDSGFISEYAVNFMDGNYDAFKEGSYLHHYPFQLGLVAFLELVYRLFGAENYLAFQLLNVAAIVATIYFLQKITWELFEDEGAVLWESVISMGMLPLFLYASFVYGDVLGIGIGTAIIYLGIRYLKSESRKYLLAAGILFLLGIPIKSNMNVLLAAFAIMMLLKFLQNKKWTALLWLLGIMALSQAGVGLVNMAYAHRAGIEKVWKGTPKAAWIAMGLQEADESDNGCGWYNGYNMDVFRDNGFDEEAAKAACIEDIENSLRRFAAEPRDAAYYFYKKFVSQWNDPTFQCLMMNEWYSRYSEEKGAVADFFIYGAGRMILSWLMNFYHLFVLACSLAGCIYIMKHWRLERAYLLLNVFGGFLFHMLWEAKSRYILGYFVLLLPVAAAGLVWAFGCLERLREKGNRCGIDARACHMGGKKHGEDGSDMEQR